MHAQQSSSLEGAAASSASMNPDTPPLTRLATRLQIRSTSAPLIPTACGLTAAAKPNKVWYPRLCGLAAGARIVPFASCFRCLGLLGP